VPVSLEEFNIRTNLCLRDKIRLTQIRIQEWYEFYNGLVYVAFSGGKDSTVLLRIVRSMYPDVPAVFCDTGLEFPLKPKMSFREVLERFGFPVISKRQAQYIWQARNTKSEVLKKLRLTGIKPDGKFSQMSKISDKWLYLIDAPFKISAKCCDIMKKNPAKAYSKKTGRMPFIGTMVSEGGDREKDYLKYGCNAFGLKSQPKSTPMAFWNDGDVWEYIRKYDVSYSEIYDMGYQRTGCVFCAFGAHMEDKKTGTNRFKRMKKTHPKLHTYCMDDLGMREVLKYIGVNCETRYEQLVLPFVDAYGEYKNIGGN